MKNIAVTRGMTQEAFAATAAVAEPENSISFRLGDAVVYATHGVGRIACVGLETIGGHSIEIVRVAFPESQMTLRVPAAKARAAGLRKLSSPEVVSDALAILDGRPRTSKAIWARRAEALKQKVNSGDLLNLARVLRDLRRNAGSLDGSHAERQIFETALDRFAGEVAAVGERTKDAVVTEITSVLQRSPALDAWEEGRELEEAA